MLGLVSLFTLAAYLVTPETAAGPAGNPLGFAFNLRYLAPALALSLSVAPLAPALAAPPARTALVLGLAVLLAGTLAQPQLWPSSHAAGAIAIGVAVVAGVAVAALSRRLRIPVAVGLVALLVLAGAAAGYRLQAHYLRGRYAYHPGVSYLSRVWALFRTVHHARVGVVGTFGGFFDYPLYGLDDSNRVQYIARRGPHGSFTPIATCPEWRSAVNHARLTYLVTTPARDPWHPKVLSPSPEDAWTASDPAAQPVFTARAEGQPITVYRIRGSLDPAGCP
jgi:hypothetical protein